MMQNELVEAVDILLAILGTYRVAHMIVSEDGPFDIFTKFRTWLYEVRNKSDWIERGFSCVLCLSFWLSWLFFVLLLVPWGWLIVTPLGIAGGALVIHRKIYS